MAGPEIKTEPSFEEAFAVLQHLASAFLEGGARLPADAPASNEAHGRCPAIVLVDEDDRVRAFDSGAERLFGRVAVEVLGARATALFGALPLGSEPLPSRVLRQDGTLLNLSVTRTVLTLANERYSVLTFLDNTHAAGDDARTELRYQHLVEQIPAVVFTAALDGGLYDIYVSPQIESLLGYSQAEWVGDPVLWYQRLHPDDRRKLDAEFAKGCVTGGPFRADCRFLTHDDEIVWVHGEARMIKDENGLPLLLQGVAFDITETKQAEELARTSLREKETLLKETHHRVKNNLQVTSSLLRLQADRIDDAAAKVALRDAQGRIRSMALVHELLYRSKDLSRVDLGEYVRDLVRQLLRTHAVDFSMIRVTSDLAAILLPIDLAVPCGLVLNELVTNALQHAFPAGRRGTIHIELRAAGAFDDLVVRDDGIGLPAGTDWRTGSTLGLRLIRTLADQIEGELDVRSEGGTEVRLRIPRRREERG